MECYVYRCQGEERAGRASDRQYLPTPIQGIFITLYAGRMGVKFFSEMHKMYIFPLLNSGDQQVCTKNYAACSVELCEGQRRHAKLATVSAYCAVRSYISHINTQSNSYNLKYHTKSCSIFLRHIHDGSAAFMTRQTLPNHDSHILHGIHDDTV